VADGNHHVYHQYVVRLTDEFPVKRTDFIKYLHVKGIGSAVHYPVPIHCQPLYARSHEPDSCPVATRLSSSVLSLPVHPHLDNRELEYICTAINKVI
jgi:perosamine synthetase